SDHPPFPPRRSSDLRHHIYRILRATKNRFGSTAELGIYEMAEEGLREVSNPSAVLIPPVREGGQSGTTIAATVEGTRPLLIEVRSEEHTSQLQSPDH